MPDVGGNFFLDIFCGLTVLPGRGWSCHMPWYFLVCAPPPMMVARPPMRLFIIHVASVFRMDGAHIPHIFIVKQQKFLMFPLDGVAWILNSWWIFGWNCNLYNILEAGNATCPGIYLLMGRPPTMIVAWPPRSVCSSILHSHSWQFVCRLFQPCGGLVCFLVFVA